MVSIARKNLFRDLGRFSISVSGVSFAVLLMLFLQGIYAGVLAQSTAYVLNAGADVWVAQEGITDMFHSASILPTALRVELAAVSGVAAVHPLYGRSLHVNVNGGAADLFVVGYDPDDGIGGPWEFVRGARRVDPGSVIVDRVFAANNDVSLGDELALLDVRLRVVGISRDASTLFNSFAFISLEDAARLSGGGENVNFFLLELDEGVRAADVEGAIEADFDGVWAYTRTEFAENNAQNARESFLPIIYAILVVGFLIGVMVVALTIYTATMEKRGEYGVLKAIGGANGLLYAIILQQSFISSVFGFAAGVGFAYLAELIVEAALPEVRIEFELIAFAVVGLAAIAIALAAAYLPIRKVAKLDPADVFRVWP
jgi:putative ABC transport system permease protein